MKEYYVEYLKDNELMISMCKDLTINDLSNIEVIKYFWR